MTELLYRRSGGVPGALPFGAFDANNDYWSDLANNPEGREACGFVAAPYPAGFDDEKQVATWDEAAEAWVISDRPAPPPPPEPAPIVLTKLQFIGLAQAAGGMTDTMLVQAKNSSAFEAFWLKFQMAESVAKADPITAASLGALAQAGYLPKGAAAVMSAWPTA